MLSPLPGHFFYFAFGSNLLGRRIKISNPSAKYVCNALLKGFYLDFDGFSSRWKGSPATIKEDPNRETWGILWQLKNENLETLDDQEGVACSIYQRLTVKVHPSTSDKEPVSAITYQLTDISCKSVMGSEKKLPSKVYKNVIIRGAEEHDLPLHYVDFLKSLPDNEYDGVVDVNLQI